MKLCILVLVLCAVAVHANPGFGGEYDPDNAMKKKVYKPTDDPYDANAIDYEKLGTINKVLTVLTDLIRGLLKGLEPSVTSLYTVIIPTVRILLAGSKIKVCRPQSRIEVIVWFVKEFVNVQLNSDLGIAQIPLCTDAEEPLSLQKWNVTYKVDEIYEKGEEDEEDESGDSLDLGGLAGDVTGALGSEADRIRNLEGAVSAVGGVVDEVAESSGVDAAAAVKRKV